MQNRNILFLASPVVTWCPILTGSKHTPGLGSESVGASRLQSGQCLEAGVQDRDRVVISVHPGIFSVRGALGDAGKMEILMKSMDFVAGLVLIPVSSVYQ